MFPKLWQFWDAKYIFEECRPSLKKLNLTTIFKIDQVFGSVTKQKEAIGGFIQIEEARKKLIKLIIPGGQDAMTHAGSSILAEWIYSEFWRKKRVWN